MGVFRRAGVILGLAVSMVLGGLQLPASGASWNEVEFVGSGWGHGVGMSQYGAYAMATTGSSYADILSYYYQGTSVGTVSSSTTIWVNLERNFSSKQLKVLNTGSSQGTAVQIIAPSGSIEARPGATISISLLAESGCRVTVANPGQSAVFVEEASNCSVDFDWYNWSQPGSNPTTKLQITGCTARGLPCQYARGTLHLRQGPGGLDLSVELLLNDYVLGISEMPASWPLEALRAQAVAARSYAEARRVARGNPATNSCDGWCHVRDSTLDQAYVGWGHPVGNWVQAATSTANQVVNHSSRPGEAITTYYSSSTGGATEFGHLKGFSSSVVPWLTSVSDAWAVDGTVPNPNASWTKTVGAQTVAAAVGLDFLWSAVVTQRREGSNSVSQVRFTGSVDGDPVTVNRTGSWVRQTFGLKSEYYAINFQPDAPGDEMMLYKTDGTFRYSDVNPDGTLGAPILSGTGYTKGWKSITAIDLDGDGQDEMMFYRDDGLFRYYEIDVDGQIGSPILAGDGYTTGWDSITAVDLDGDGRDEIMFYREDGLFRYYDIAPNGQIGRPILAGDGYTTGWNSITAVDLDGDGQDEMFFYRDDGLFRYYNIRPNGQVGLPLTAGEGYTSGWSSIRAIDLDGDRQDEMFFYRQDGLYRFYNVKSDGSLSSPMTAGSNFGQGWDEIEAINLDGR